MVAIIAVLEWFHVEQWMMFCDAICPDQLVSFLAGVWLFLPYLICTQFNSDYALIELN